MNWLDNPNMSKSHPYMIHSETRGFSLWIQDPKRGYQVIGREYVTRQAAKNAAEQHKSNVRQTG